MATSTIECIVYEVEEVGKRADRTAPAVQEAGVARDGLGGLGGAEMDAYMELLRRFQSRRTT